MRKLTVQFLDGTTLVWYPDTLVVDKDGVLKFRDDTLEYVSIPLANVKYWSSK